MFFSKLQLQAKRARAVPLMLLFMFAAISAQAQLSGNYTIDSSAAASSTNYRDFKSAVSDMVSGTRQDGGSANGAGVSGAVTFNVANGVYAEQIIIKSISGASATNRITFQSASGDSTKVIVTHSSSTSSTGNFTLQLDSADFITIRSMTIQRTGTSSKGKVIELINGAHHNIITNNRILGVTTTGTSTDQALIHSPNTKDSANQILNNSLKGGAVGIYLQASSGSTEEGTIVKGNLLDNIVDDQIFITYQVSPLIEGNIITNKTGTSGYGIYLANSVGSAKFIKNKILNIKSSWGMYMVNVTATSSNPGMMANNFVSYAGTSANGGIGIHNSANIHIYYNNVLVTNTSKSATALYINSGSSQASGNLKVFNNILTNTGGGSAIAISANADNTNQLDSSDHNNLFVSGSVLGVVGSTNAADIATWRTVSGQDLTSISVNPKFVSNTDLHVNALLLNGKAMPLTAITDDIDGQARNSTNPDIGADEIFPPANNLAVISLLAPADQSCGDSINYIRIVIENQGADSQSNFTVDVAITGAVTDSFSYIYTGKLAPDGRDTVTFPDTLNTYAGGNFNITGFTSLSNDQDRTNDTASVSVNIIRIATNPVVSDTVICSNQSVSLTTDSKDAGSTLSWFSSPTATTPLFTGDTFNTPVLFDTVTYYVHAYFGQNCPSKRIPLTVNVKKSVNGATVVKGATFNGTFNTGTASDPDAVCAGNTIIYSLNPPKGFDNADFDSTWSITNLTFATANGTPASDTVLILPDTATSANATLSFTPKASLADSTFILNVTIRNNATGCDSSFSRYVFVGVQTEANFGIPANACFGEPVNITDSSKVSAGTAYKYSFGDGDSSFSANPTHLYATPGSYNVTLFLMGPGGCTDTISKSITVHPLPTGATIVAGSTFDGIFNAGTAVNPDQICIGNKIVYELKPPTGYANADYDSTWTISALTFATANGTANTDTTLSLPDSLGNGMFGFTPSAAFADSTLILNITLRNVMTGCDSSFSRHISVSVKPVANFTFSNVCNGNTVVFSDSSIVSAGTTYRFTFGDGDTSTSANPTHLYNAPGKYDVKLFIMGPGGCADSITKTVTVYPSVGGAAIVKGSTFDGIFNAGTAVNPDQICIGNKIVYELNPPAGYANADYDSTWTISALTFATANGTANTDTTLSLPDSLGNGMFGFTPSAAFADSTLILNITLRNVVTGCDSSFSRHISVSVKPVANFTFSNVCNGNTVVFSDSSIVSAGTTYRFTFGDGDTSTSANPTHLYNAPGKYDVKLFIMGPGGCDDSVTKTVTVYPRPVPVFTTANVCEGDSVRFNNTSSILSGTVNYLWNFGDGDTTSTVSPVHFYNTPGTYTVKLVITSDFGCMDSLTKSVTVFPMPVAKFSAIATICEGLTVNITDSSTISSGTIARAWSFGDGVTSTSTNPTHVYSIPGTYDIKLVTTGAGGCKDSMIKTITVYPSPVAAFTTADVCEGNNVNFSNTSSISAGTIAHMWTFGDGDTSTAVSPSHLYKTPGKYDVKLVITSSLGCKDSATHSVTVSPMPVANFGANYRHCFGTAVVFADSSKISAGTISRAWSFGDGNTSTSVSPVYQYSAPGTYDVKLVVTAATGCKDSVTKTITVNPMPSADFTVADVCGTNNLQITNNSSITSGTLSYLWSFGDGNTSTAQKPTYSYSNAGSYNVKLVVTSDQGCKDSITKSISVFPALTANFGAASNACQGQTIRFTDSSVVVGGYSRNWSFGDGNTSTAANPMHAFANAGTYNVKLVITSLDGCIDSISKTIIIGTAPVANFTAITNGCAGESILFSDASSITSGTITGYLWDFGNGNTSTLQNPAFAFTSSGAYNVKLVVTGDGGCKDSVTKSVIINPAPKAAFGSVSICSNQSAQFIDSSTISTGAIANRLWYFGDGTTAAVRNPSHTYAQAGTYTVSLVVSSGSGCTDSVAKTITIFDVPVAAFSAQDVCEGETMSFTNTSSIANGTLSYIWNFGDGDTSTAKNPQHSFDAPGAYKVTLIAISANQCADTISSTVNVFAKPAISWTASHNSREVTFTPSDTTLAQYEWNFGNGKTSTEVKPTHTYTNDSTYTVTLTVKNSNGCESVSVNTITVMVNSIIKLTKAELNLNIYPNPFKELTQVAYQLEKSAKVKVSVYDMSGKEVTVVTDQTQTAGKYTYTIDADALNMKSGVYLMRVLVDDSIITRQIIRVK